MRTILAAVLSLPFLAPDVAAQCNPCLAQHDDAVFADGTSMGGPNLLLAIKATAPSALTVLRIEMFTGEGNGTNTVAIWSHDGNGNRPASQLAVGSFPMSPNNTWQGANLGQPVNLAAGSTFWIVWGPQNGAQASVRNNTGSSQQYRGSFDGGSSWSGPFADHEWKYRLYCCPREPGAYLPFGTGCAGSSRKSPQLGNVGVPTLGQSFQVTLANAPAQASVFFVLGLSDQSWLGLTLPFDLGIINAPGCRVLCSHDAVLPQTADGAGAASRLLGVPGDPALLAAVFFNQWIVVDPPANPLQLTTSNGGKGTIGKD
jgi:hypothetical protein